MNDYRPEFNLWYHLRPDGTIVPANGLAMQPAEERRIDATDVPQPAVRVSTVFLGLDHRHGWADEPAAPILFETMVFGGPYNDYCERYTTVEAAREGHLRICQAIEAGRNPGEKATLDSRGSES